MKDVKRPAKEAILDAASKEFARNGFPGVRMEQVAKAAGCNKALVYRYYGDKEGLFKAVLMAQFEKRAELLTELPERLDDRLVRWFKATLDDPDFMRLIQWEALERNEKPIVQEEFRRTYYEAQIASLKTLQDEGVISAKFDARYLFFAMLAIVVFPSTFPQIARLVTGHDPDSEEFGEGFSDFAGVFAAMLAG